MAYIDIYGLQYEYREVGKTFSSSKILHIWTFTLEDKFHKIEFWDSKLSGKKKIAADAQVILLDKKSSGHFSQTFKLSNHLFTIQERGEDTFVLLIDNRKFDDIKADEQSGKLGKLRKKAKEELKQKELEEYERIMKEKFETDEYNRRAMEYNGTNYVEGMEQEIIRKQEKEKEKERERRKQKEKERERSKDKVKKDKKKNDEIVIKPGEINMIKHNLHSTNTMPSDLFKKNREILRNLDIIGVFSGNIKGSGNVNADIFSVIGMSSNNQNNIGAGNNNLNNNVNNGNNINNNNNNMDNNMNNNYNNNYNMGNYNNNNLNNNNNQNNQNQYGFNVIQSQAIPNLFNSGNNVPVYSQSNNVFQSSDNLRGNFNGNLNKENQLEKMMSDLVINGNNNECVGPYMGGLNNKGGISNNGNNLNNNNNNNNNNNYNNNNHNNNSYNNNIINNNNNNNDNNNNNNSDNNNINNNNNSGNNYNFNFNNFNNNNNNNTNNFGNNDNKNNNNNFNNDQNQQQNKNQLNPNLSINLDNMDVSLNNNTIPPGNQFKDQILGTGLVDLNNLADQNKKVNFQFGGGDNENDGELNLDNMGKTFGNPGSDQVGTPFDF